MKKPHYQDPGKSRPKAHLEAASALAVAALSFLAGDQERLERFLALTGLGPQSLRAAAREPSFLLGVLDHVAGDESLLLAFAARSGIRSLGRGACPGSAGERPGHTGAA